MAVNKQRLAAQGLDQIEGVCQTPSQKQNTTCVTQGSSQTTTDQQMIGGVCQTPSQKQNTTCMTQGSSQKTTDQQTKIEGVCPKSTLLHKQNSLTQIPNLEPEQTSTRPLDTPIQDNYSPPQHTINRTVQKQYFLETVPQKRTLYKTRHLKGGVAIYTKEHLKENSEAIITIEDLSIEMVREVAAIKLKVGKSIFIIVGIYRPDNNLESGLEVLAEALENLQSQQHPIILMGDINIVCLKNQNDTTLLIDTLASYNLYRRNLPATRITPTSRTSINCVCCNIREEEITVKVIETSISDHTGQLCRPIIKGRKTQTPTTTCWRGRNMSHRNILTMKHLLSQEIWTEVYNSNEVNTFATALTDRAKNYNLTLRLGLARLT
ncbi:hypothetical protein J6590_025755 [Homalodisca vitripennis]|nr:hypothetical protein J6590_025755 [Homalodisca vitripennis]